MPESTTDPCSHQARALSTRIKQWGQALGFQQVGICDASLPLAEQRLAHWLKQKWHGDMFYMEKHGLKRSRPDVLAPGTLSIISVRMDYWPHHYPLTETVFQQTAQGYISRYALGRDYHKVLRKRLKRLAEKIIEATGPFQYRVFVDSAPVLEKPIAEKAGLGWIGKHTNLINQYAGSWFFLGEIYTDLPLAKDAPGENHCGTCSACMDVCPTQAIVAPYQLDARRCISYLTIELHGAIPVEYRKSMGNRIYGCDDCQIVCPWNRFARITRETDFLSHRQLDNRLLLELFSWDEEEFLNRTEGSAIRRIGYIRWLRNIAVALGNATPTTEITAALEQRSKHPSELVREHVRWALDQHSSATR